MTGGLPQSVQARLVRHAAAAGVDPNRVLARYAAERFLYRLSRSRYVDRFVLKGALLLEVWLGESARATRDADLLGLGEWNEEAIAAMTRELCALQVEPDGLFFDAATILVSSIRPEDGYGGYRVTLTAGLGPARLPVQVDIGLGDAVVPAAGWLEYPSLLDLPRPRLRGYRPETVIAEKLHAMVWLGAVNSRMKDFYDLHALAEREAFKGRVLAEAVGATFERRNTTIPAEAPIALTPAFSEQAGKPAQWSAFLRRAGLTEAPPDLGLVVRGLAEFLLPVLVAVRQREPFLVAWPPGGPWKEA